MHRIGAWATTVALLVAWHADTVCAGEPGRPQTAATADNQESKSWWKRNFGKSEPPKVVEAPAQKPVPKERPRDVAARTLEQEQAEYFRRLDVVTKMRQIAFETSNPALDAQADEIEREATEVYSLRTAHLPSARLKPVPEQALDQQLGSGIATNPLQAGSTPGKTATAGLGNKEGKR